MVPELTSSRPLLVLGRTGMLGQALCHELERRGIPFDARDRRTLDISTVAALGQGLRRESSFGALVNATAFNDVGAAEDPGCRDLAFHLNRDAPAEMAAFCAEREIPMLHLSTDYVFDGRSRRPYREGDPVHPLQVYGRSKLAGERAVLGVLPRALIARTSNLFGPGRPPERPHYVESVLRAARSSGRVEVVRLPVSSPTYCPDLARALIDLLLAGAEGIVHVANRGQASRLELAQATVDLAGLRVPVVERAADDLQPRRPPYSVLDTRHFTGLRGQPLRPWRGALEEYLRRKEPG